MMNQIRQIQAAVYALKAVFFTRSSATVSVLEIEGGMVLIHVEGMTTPQWMKAGYPPYGDTLTVHFRRDIGPIEKPADATEALLRAND